MKQCKAQVSIRSEDGGKSLDEELKLLISVAGSFAAVQSWLDWEAVGTTKSSSVTEGQQGFHLHTSGFEPNKLFWGPGVSDKDYITESPLIMFKKKKKRH